MNANILFAAISTSREASYSEPEFSAASLAFSRDTTSQAASSAQSQQGGSLTITSAKCFTSNVQLQEPEYTFHPSFVADLRAAMQTPDDTQMQAVIRNYGTHYYKSASIF